MSQPPKRRQPPQSAQRSRSQRQDDAYYDEEEYYDYPEERQAPSRRRPAPGYGPQRGGRYYQQRPYYVEPKRDMFPVIMGGLLGAMIVGIGLIIILLLNNNNTTTPTPTTTTGNNNGPVASATPPRMPIDEFKKLYDNTATRPMIIDVRAAEAFNEGHIAGALSMPEANIDSLVSQIPKGSLVVAYCQ